MTPHGTALLDTRRGRGTWQVLDPVSTQLWARIISGTPAPDAIEDLSEHWSRRGIDPQRVREDLSTVASDLARARLLEPADRTPAPTEPLPVRFTTARPVPLRTQIAAQAGLALALTLLRCAPLRFTIAAARAATRLPGRPATLDEAETLHTAVRRAARGWIGRAACLEESLGTLLTGALCGRRTRWVLGASFLPQGAHAWTEADGHIIGQAPEDRVWPYVPVLTVERSN
ncbi:lasso peptide biosynthesis B2 protein [Streptomyces wuyuanensis]|uniref:lasso peptide biosynthesis B2 protein n=1 Tax=Streptomyces wuyuanensis TaxID=1196353 RepID=UPI00371061D0